MHFLLTCLNGSKLLLLCSLAFLLLFRKGMFGLKLKKKKKAEKGLILANKGAQGEGLGAGQGVLPWGLPASELTPLWLRAGLLSWGVRADVLPAGSSHPTCRRCGPGQTAPWRLAVWSLGQMGGVDTCWAVEADPMRRQ